MNQVIFKNSKTLSSKDIILQLLIGVGVLILVGLFSPIRDKGQTSWTIFFVISGLVFVIWTIKALTEKTLKSVEINNNDKRVLFVINQQFKRDKTFDFQLKNMSLDMTHRPDRSPTPNKILKVKDEDKKLTISSRQKGLSEQVLQNIALTIKHYPQQGL
jgi:hypothetical protein